MGNKSNDSLHYSDRVLQLAKEDESYAEMPYLDTLAKPPVWTRGYGDTHFDASEKNTPVSVEFATHLLAEEMDVCEVYVKELVKVPLTQGQIDALVDFTYNEGPTHLASSHLLAFLNSGHPELAALEFAKWNLAGGVVEPGLSKRREQERVWFVEHGETLSTSSESSIEQPTLLSVLGA